MKFVCLLPVRDEADIVAQCVQQLLTWADEIFVFDTGSVDDTWEIVQDAATRDRRVIPIRKEPVYFSETRLRGWMFHHARGGMANGDWFLRVDADEFHHIAPPEFVKSRLAPHETIVYHQYYNFCLLDSEVQNWTSGAESVLNRRDPIENRRQWYLPSAYSEPRLCRYRQSMRWPPTVSFPFNAGFIAKNRLPIRHYPHRDPMQLERRCKLRAIMMADKQNRANWSHPELHHWVEQEWRKFITPDDTQGLKRWVPGTHLDEAQLMNHLGPVSRRVVQRVVHLFFLPMLDRMRKQWSASSYPQRIPDEIVELLKRELQV